MVCNGNPATREQYKGELKGEPLRDWLGGFRSGSRCSGLVKLDESTDLGALSVAKLKAILQARGWACQGCLEKGDYIASIRSQLGVAS